MRTHYAMTQQHRRGRKRPTAVIPQIAQFRRKRSKQAGQREIDPHAPPAPDFIFDQRIAW